MSGTSGGHDLNGFWEPDATLQRRGGRVVYVKANNSKLCIEHYGGHWVLKWRKNIGQAHCLAHVEGGCALEDCSSRLWHLLLSHGSSVQFNDEKVKMRTGEKAMHKVSSSYLQAFL